MVAVTGLCTVDVLLVVCCRGAGVGAAHNFWGECGREMSEILLCGGREKCRKRNM